jgi:hypothetical protein
VVYQGGVDIYSLIGFANRVFVLLQWAFTFLRSGGMGGFLTNENTMDENPRESRLTQWTYPRS